MNRIKLIHVVLSFDVGGIETTVLELCNKFNKREFDVHLLILTNDRLKMQSLINDDVTIHVLNFKLMQLKSINGYYLALRNLISILNEVKPQIVQTHLYFTHLFLVSLAIKLSIIKSLHFRTVHTDGLFYSNPKTLINKFRLFVEKIATKLNKTYVIGVSKIVHRNNLNYFRNIAEDIKFIPNGVDFNKYDALKYKHITKSKFNIRDDALVVTYVARLDYGKNHQFLIEIWPKVKLHTTSAILCFAGSGVLETELKNQVNKSELQSSIMFLGAINNVSELLSISDIAVFPSSFEGFSLVFLEKLAMKLPVVASDIEVFKELVQHNEGAYLISLEQREEWIKKIITLCEDSSLRRFIGESGYCQVTKYSIENTVCQYSEYYKYCLELDEA